MERIAEESATTPPDDIPEAPLTAAQLAELEAAELHAAATAKAVRTGASLVGTLVSIKA